MPRETIAQHGARKALKRAEIERDNRKRIEQLEKDMKEIGLRLNRLKRQTLHLSDLRYT